jgi:predicted alpha/beta-fold hydrolase
MPPQADPTEHEPFQPRRGLSGGHMQTFASVLLPRAIALPAGEERLVRVAPDAQVLCRCHWQAERRRALTLLLVHGLEGSIDSQYMLGAAHKALAAGMSVVRMNMRNCGGTEHLSATLYHSGLSADVGAVARVLLEEEQLPALALAGFSMGGNLVLKLAGEWGTETPAAVRAFAAVSPAMDLSASADLLHRPRNRLYEWYFLRGLKQRMRHKDRLFPGRFDLSALRGLRSIRDFDDRITAPYGGFAGAEDYYHRASARHGIARIARPTLVLHAEDDPFILLLRETRERLRANPRVRLEVSRRGGHCAFLAPPNGYDGRWAERRIISFLQRF